MFDVCFVSSFFFFFFSFFITKTRLFKYSNILKILQPKMENFHIKILIFFHIFAQKHRLWVLVRTVSVRWF